MVRHCAVPSCKNTDLTILCHRFPKRKDAFHQWQSSLCLDDFDANLLMQRFVVCTHHFKQSDYRNANSRMLNAVAVPTLASNDGVKWVKCFDLGETEPLCDEGKSTTGESNDESPDIVEVENSINTEEESVPTDGDCALIIEDLDEIEPLESLEDECEEDIVYFIEETESNEGQITRIISPVDETEPEPEPEEKRIKLDHTSPTQPLVDDDLESKNPLIPEPIAAPPVEVPKPSPPTPIATYRNSSVQTEDVQIVSEEDQLQRRMVEEFYPEYAGCSRLDLAKQLKDREERLTEMTKKLANFEAAHTAMMKTMEAFKTLVN
ncbi:hypothetical protein RP20_CCG002020 [Aedes albopictus]|nr:hypothetical protein RP20_CCG002020 [Aedes albopictus]